MVADARVVPGTGYPDGETNPAGRRPRPVRLARPRSSIGTIASTGPYTKLRLDIVRRYSEGYNAWSLIILGGTPVRAAARILGLSPTTAWRRAHWYGDQNLNRMYGYPDGPIPQQRGTRAVPRGRPIVLPHDAGYVIDVLLADGYTLEDIAASTRTIPACVRRIAAARARTARQNPGETP